VAADLSSATLAQDTDVLSVSLDVWRHTIDVTLSGYMYGIRHALPIMIGQGRGAIVNTMSTSVWVKIRSRTNPPRRAFMG
jgi:NAD(P)-dependent dehydrogenase (short-subunit alcohol dehydrogenase family)